MIPIRNKNTDISSDVARGNKLQKKVDQLSELAANKSINETKPLDEVIAEISRNEGFNRLQIQRLVEEANTVTYNKRYDKLRNSHDRRITFLLASLDGVIKEMGFSAPPEVSNPNLSKGGEGEGELKKVASTIEPSYVHNPNRGARDRYNKRMEKLAARKVLEDKKSNERKQADKDSTIFKIANSLVMTERMYKNANTVFNTLLSDVDFNQSDVDRIIEKTAEINEYMVKTRRSHPDFVVALEEDSMDKVASHVLGEYSLLKTATVDKVEEIKVQPTSNINDFKQLVELAKRLEREQDIKTNERKLETKINEVNVNGK